MAQELTSNMDTKQTNEAIIDVLLFIVKILEDSGVPKQERINKIDKLIKENSGRYNYVQIMEYIQDKISNAENRTLDSGTLDSDD